MIISIGIIIALSIIIIWLVKNRVELIAINEDRAHYNKTIEDAIQIALSQLEKATEDSDRQAALVKSLTNSAKELEKNAEIRANEAYEIKIKNLEAKAQERKEALSADYDKQKELLDSKLKKEEEKLHDLESKQLAYIQAQQRQEEILSNQDYYRLAIDKIDLNDIELLRELQPKFYKKESIDKLIWEVYYKPAYDILTARLFSSAKVCGIYKITDLTTGQAYIGQSVDIRERFRQHIKTSLTYGKATNKLYQTMQKSGQFNFTFEILEKVPKDKLNERETYWIDFYKTKEFGLNSTKGGA